MLKKRVSCRWTLDVPGFDTRLVTSVLLPSITCGERPQLIVTYDEVEGSSMYNVAKKLILDPTTEALHAVLNYTDHAGVVTEQWDMQLDPVRVDGEMLSYENEGPVKTIVTFTCLSLDIKFSSDI